MKNPSQAAQEFLSQKRIAVVGVSRTGSGAACAIFRKLRETGHETCAVNSKGGEVDGICLHLDLIPIATPDGVVVVTPAPAALGVVEECARLGIKRVWLHRGMDGGSTSPEAIDYCRSAGILVILGACPGCAGADRRRVGALQRFIVASRRNGCTVGCRFRGQKGNSGLKEKI